VLDGVAGGNGFAFGGFGTGGGVQGCGLRGHECESPNGLNLEDGRWAADRGVLGRPVVIGGKNFQETGTAILG
jgi:hypothetical protein